MSRRYEDFPTIFWVLAKPMASILLSWTYCSTFPAPSLSCLEATRLASQYGVMSPARASQRSWVTVILSNRTLSTWAQNSHLRRIETPLNWRWRIRWIDSKKVAISLSKSDEGQRWDKWDIASYSQWSFEATNNPNSMTPHPPAFSFHLVRMKPLCVSRVIVTWIRWLGQQHSTHGATVHVIGVTLWQRHLSHNPSGPSTRKKQEIWQNSCIDIFLCCSFNFLSSVYDSHFRFSMQPWFIQCLSTIE